MAFVLLVSRLEKKDCAENDNGGCVAERVQSALVSSGVCASVKRVDVATDASDFTGLVAEERSALSTALSASNGPVDILVALLDSNTVGSGLASAHAVPYDFRFVWTPTSTESELLEELRVFLRPLGSTFTSTRHSAESTSLEQLTFLNVVREGLAPDGGLFNLAEIPKMSASQLSFILGEKAESGSNGLTAEEGEKGKEDGVAVLSYKEVAMLVLERLVDRSITPSKLLELVEAAYDAAAWSGKSNICPVTALLRPEDTAYVASAERSGAYSGSTYLMELFHGPTAAFKDFALQLFPRYFVVASEQSSASSSSSSEPATKYMILAATSGDTGVAAISGFVRASSTIKVAVLYPQRGVSPVQRMQMVSFDNGSTVRVYGVDSDFDFCQGTVKNIFTDAGLAAKLLKDANTKLSSANSINWGRLIPQVVYYFWTYRSLVARGALKAGEPMDIAVPTGNFGNILAGYFAKLLGLPIGKFVLASNQNDVLKDFVLTGTYDIRERHLVATASPSIDILKASNVERFLFLLSNGDSALVAKLMQDLQTEKCFTIPPHMQEAMKREWWAASCSESECGETIRDVFTASGNTRILDPHTAVAVRVTELYRAQFPDRASIPIAIASTAHWAKFPQPVMCALKGEELAISGGSPDPAVEVTKEVETYYGAILSLCPQERVHPALQAALDAAKAEKKEPRHYEADNTVLVNEVVSFAQVKKVERERWGKEKK